MPRMIDCDIRKIAREDRKRKLFARPLIDMNCNDYSR